MKSWRLSWSCVRTTSTPWRSQWSTTACSWSGTSFTSQTDPDSRLPRPRDARIRIRYYGICLPRYHFLKKSITQLVFNFYSFQNLDKILLDLIKHNISHIWCTTVVQLISLVYKDQHVITLQVWPIRTPVLTNQNHPLYVETASKLSGKFSVRVKWGQRVQH